MHALTTSVLVLSAYLAALPFGAAAQGFELEPDAQLEDFAERQALEGSSLERDYESDWSEDDVDLGTGSLAEREMREEILEPEIIAPAAEGDDQRLERFFDYLS